MSKFLRLDFMKVLVWSQDKCVEMFLYIIILSNNALFKDIAYKWHQKKMVTLTFSFKWHLDQFQPNLIEILLRWSSFKCVQRYKLCRELMLLWYHKGRQTPTLLNSSLNPLVWFQDNLAEMFFEWPSTTFVQAIFIDWKTWPLVDIRNDKSLKCNYY